MKPTYSRRYRRNVSPAREAVLAKKDNQQEQPFFSPASSQSFFKPNAAIQRKCEKCEAEDKNVKRMTEKEEEKPIQKMEEKKEEEKPIQKMEEKKEEEKPIQKMEEKKEEERPIQKMEEEKKLDKKENGRSGQVADQTNSYVYSLSGKGNTLPGETQQFFKQRMGYDFSHVRIHTDANAAKSAKDLNAKAYATDNHIVFNNGQYNPGSAEGKKLLAHELTHVAQQQGNGPEVLKSAGQLQINKKEDSQPTYSTGKATNSRNERAFGCEGVEVEGHTDANYTDSYTSTGTAKPSTKCADCGEPDCVTAGGTIKSVFKANPVVTLPSVPDGLSECETKAVSKFINTTLKNHEQAHVNAFNSYNATIKTPYKFSGCQADLDGYIQSLHDGINEKRTAAANKKSAKLDPFNPKIPCKCD